jgi:hypothetical protein
LPALFCSGKAIHPFVFAFFAAKAATSACPIRLFVAILLSVDWAVDADDDEDAAAAADDDDDEDEVAEDEVDDDEDEVSAEEGGEVEDDSKLRTQALAASRAFRISIMRAYIL